MRQQLAGLIGLVLFFAGSLAWIDVWQRRRLFRITDQQDVPLGRVPLVPFVIASAYIGFSFALVILADPTGDQPKFDNFPSVEQLSAGLAMSLMIWAAILLALRVASRGLSSQGIELAGLGKQVLLGIQGFLLAIVPSVLAIVVLSILKVRTEETQNPLLQALQKTSDPGMWITIGITAVLAAPLLEELLFRVILQGGLADRFGLKWGIALSTVVFAASHGFADALALLPLSLLLGILRAQSRSYLAVVVVHALFNGTMLVLMFLVIDGSPIPL